MKIKYVFFIISLLFFALKGISQEGAISCGVKMSSKEEVLFKEALMHQQKMIGSKKNASKTSEKIYSIPVIFHLFDLYRYGEEEFTEEGKQNIRCYIETACELSSKLFSNTFTAEDLYPAYIDQFLSVDKRFTDVRGKLNIEFVPATVDPYGNVLEIPGVNMLFDQGINKIDNAKISLADYNWWGKNNRYYLDVFVTDIVESGEQSVRGDSFLPITDIKPLVVMADDYLMGFGYAPSEINGMSFDCFGGGNLSTTLVHEFGHYFGLKHTFDGGCKGDGDGVDDTPATNQLFGCGSDILNSCGVYPNYENFMSYNVHCRSMFTKGQVAIMDYWLNEEKTDINKHPRRNLWQPENLKATGVIPSDIIADFKSEISICTGEEIVFKDNSLGKPTSWKWEFEGGKPAVSTERNPSVTYENPGKYNVKLTVSDELRSRSHTVLKNEYVYVDEGLVDYIEVEKFDNSFPPKGWSINNPDGVYKWHQRVGIGKGDLFSLVMDNKNNKVIGEKDYIQTPNYDFSNAFKAQMYFDIAYTKFDDASPDALTIQVSKDCGVSWEDVYTKTHTELQTTEISSDLSNDWIPIMNHHWRKEIIDLSKYDGESKVSIRFENTSGYGTKIMIDNLRIKRTGNDRPTAYINYQQLAGCVDMRTVNFKDESIGADTTRSWYFEGGTPSSSTEKNVTVVYETPGVYDVLLVSKNLYGEDTKEVKELVSLGETIETNYVETFSGNFPPVGWIINNPDNKLTWEKRTDAGNGDTHCMIMNNADNPSDNIDEITLSAIDVSTGISNLSFDIAYTKFDHSNEDILKIKGSIDCGNTWDLLYKKNHEELETVEIPSSESNDWIPTEDAHWRLENVSLERYMNVSSDLMIKFENISGFGTRIWIDNIKLYSKPDSVKSYDNDRQLIVYPNPSNELFNLDLSMYQGKKSTILIHLYDITGKIIEKKHFTSKIPSKISLGSELSGSGAYFIKIFDGNETNFIKVLKQ